MVKPIAVQLYSLRREAEKDFVQVLKDVAGMGYAGVEFAGLHGMPASEVAGIIRDLGLVACSAHVGIPQRDNINAIAEEAAALGYRHIVGGFGVTHMDTLDGAKACAEKLRQACELARSVGLTLHLHNHWCEFDHEFDGVTPYEIIMAGAPDVYSELDVYWCMQAKRDVPEVVRRYAKRIKLLHLKDGDLGEPPVHKALGQGRVPVKEIIEAGDEATLEWLIVELDECATDMGEAVAESCQYLRELGLGRGPA